MDVFAPSAATAMEAQTALARKTAVDIPRILAHLLLVIGNSFN
jgi:hypothetical protein